jgi:hypothetical protein
MKLGQRACLAGIIFFTVKGLLWLIVPFLAVTYGCWQ